jgi:hypothetical protein
MGRFKTTAALVGAILIGSFWVGNANATVVLNPDGNASTQDVSASSVGDIFNITYTCFCGFVSLSAETEWQVTALSGSSMTFKVTVANNTFDLLGSARIVSFGVDVLTPDPTGASISNDSSLDSENWGVSVNVNFPSFNTVDLCVWAGSNCSGGGNDGMREGESDIVYVTLTGANFTNGITLKTFPMKFQSVGLFGGSYEIGGTIETPPPPPPSDELPEPTTLGLIGAGLFGLGLVRRRRRT